jgi:hypothetical protein
MPPFHEKSEISQTRTSALRFTLMTTPDSVHAAYMARGVSRRFDMFFQELY